MIVLETERLRLRWATFDDAQFFIDLLNSPGWLDNIGDRKVRTIKDAETYIRLKLMPDYDKGELGMYLIEAKEDGRPVGTTGFVNRPGLEGIDMGFAMLTEEMNKGYAFEASFSLLQYGKKRGVKLLKGITLPENTSSRKLLEKLGFTLKREFYLKDDPDLLCLYEMNL